LSHGLQPPRKRRLSISADAVLQELARIAFANMMDYMTIQEGDAYVDLSKVTREQAAAIQEITSETYIDGYEGKGEEEKPIVVKRTKFKLGEAAGPRPATKNVRKFFAEHSFWTARSAIGRPQGCHPLQNPPAGKGTVFPRLSTLKPPG